MLRPAEADDVRGLDEARQRFDADAGRREVYALIVQAQAVVAGLLLVQRGRERALDARADQAAQDGFTLHPGRSFEVREYAQR
jgi:hypothetical protein